MIEHGGGEKEDSTLWRTINNHDIVLRVIERGFIHGALTIENRAAWITRGGTKGMTNHRGEGKDRRGGEGGDGCIIFTRNHCCIRKSDSR